MVELLDDQVLIRVLHAERMTASKLLWIPDGAKRQSYELWNGFVEAVGPGERAPVAQTPNEVARPTQVFREKRKAMDVKVGDKVTFYFLAGMTATRWPDEDHLIIPENMIQLVWE